LLQFHNATVLDSAGSIGKNKKYDLISVSGLETDSMNEAELSNYVEKLCKYLSYKGGLLIRRANQDNLLKKCVVKHLKVRENIDNQLQLNDKGRWSSLQICIGWKR